MEEMIVLGIALWTGVMGFLFGQMYQIQKGNADMKNENGFGC